MYVREAGTTSFGDPIAVAERTANVTGLKPVTKYELAVSAYTINETSHDVAGDGPQTESVTASTEQDRPTDPPQSVQVASLTATSLVVTWSPPMQPNGPITGYEVRAYIAGQSGNVLNHTHEGDKRSTTFVGLLPFVMYEIQVRARTAIGYGPAATVRQRTQSTNPTGAPNYVSASAQSSTSLFIQWDPIASDAINGNLQSYVLQYWAGQSVTPPVSAVMLNVTSGNVTVENLDVFTVYAIRVQGINDVGAGPFSDVTFAVTGESAPRVAVDKVEVLDTTRTSITVGWMALIGPQVKGVLRGYKVYFRRTPKSDAMYDNKTSSWSSEDAGIQLNYTVTGLTGYLEYEFAVAGYTRAGEGPRSSPVVLGVTSTDLPAAAPNNVTVKALNSTAVVMSWEELQPRDRRGQIVGYKTRYKVSGF